MEKRTQTISVERALEDVKAGRLIIIVDDEDRENEGDLMVAAEKATPEIINFMTKHGRGLICLPLTLQGTNLGDLRSGDTINLECDMVGKYAYNWFSQGRLRR